MPFCSVRRLTATTFVLAALLLSNAVPTQHAHLLYYYNQETMDVNQVRVNVDADYHLEDGTYLGTIHDSYYENPEAAIGENAAVNVVGGAATVVAGQLAYNYAPVVANWAASMGGTGYWSTWFGYWGIVAGPYAALFMATGVGLG